MSVSGARSKLFMVVCVCLASIFTVVEAQRSDTIVRMAVAPRYAGGGLLVQEIAIGSETQGADYIFSRILTVQPMRDGSVWIADVSGELASAEYRIRKYGPNGKFVTNVSRMGDGPGELRAAGGMTELRDGRIAVRDVRRNKVEVFTRDGKHSATWTFGDARMAGITGLGDGIFSDTAGFVYLNTDISKPFVPGVPQYADESENVFVRLGPDGKIRDTLRTPSLPDVRIQSGRVVVPTTAVAGGGGGGTRRGGPPPGATQLVSTRTYSVPHSPESAWYVSPLGYVVTTVNTRYAIDLRIPRAGGAGLSAWRSGDPVVSIRRNTIRLPVSVPERRERGEVLLQNMTIARGTVSTQPGEIPAVKPAFRSVSFGLDGTIWVTVPLASERAPTPVARRGRGGTGWIEPFVLDVFEPSGVYLGQVSVPEGVTLKSRTRDTVYAVHTDDLGINTVRRYRISWK